MVHTAVRHEHRSSNTRLALLGVGALALLASIGGSAARSDEAVDVATVTVGSQVAVPADGSGAEAIRSVDFGDVAQPGSACAQGLRFTPPASIPVTGGTSQVLDLASLTQLSVDPEVSYGDVDGDGRDDAVVHVTCSFGANGAEDSVHVWSLEGDRLIHVAGLDQPGADMGDGLPPIVQSVAAEGDRVVVTWAAFDDDDPRCCPTLETRAGYVLDGDELVPVGDPVTTPARP
ncbi:MAG TPA: hypothetical protein VK360_06610 [Acidimicrobiales bacterium]|nr:hypothetical protein [Acidimicrobiales bacterium]